LGTTKSWGRAVVAAALVCGALAAMPAGRAHAASGGATVDVFPEPGSIAANAGTTIAVRGVTGSQIGAISVTGAQSGAHSGSWIADSDGNGASFVPATRFAPGEHVNVHTALTVRKTGNGDFGFTVSEPAPVGAAASATSDADLGLGLDVNVHRTAAAAAPAAWSFVSRPDLQPPKLTATMPTGSTAGGVIALTPRGSGQYGPLLVDDHGNPVWFTSVTDFHFTTDAKIVQYKGQPAIAWWEGDLNGQGHGDGQYEMLDNTYHRIAVVNANGYQADLHDFQITSRDTALVLVYDHVPQNGKNVLELTVQEIDIPTGNKLFEWHSLDHVPTSASAVGAPGDSTTEWDYFHGNSVSVDPSDGNYLISARNTSTVYKIDRVTGAIIWKLGKGGDFTPSPSFADSQWFAFQHDVRFRSDGTTLGLFDNGSGVGPAPHTYSRGLELSIDQAKKTVSIVRELRAPTDVLASSQGAFRDIGGGHDFIGWGAIGEMTEYDANHNPVLDLTFPTGVQSYRAVKAQWHATPSVPPDVVSARIGTSVRASVSWNGATEVATWTLLAGPDPAHLAVVTSAPRTGFETTLTGLTGGSVVVAEARDAGGHVLGRSQPVVPAGTVDHSGYWLARTDGTVHAFGAPPYAKSSIASGRHVVGVASAGSGAFWMALSDGTVLGDGTASLGSVSAGALRGHGPITAIASAPDGHGYWLLGIDGTVFRFGTAVAFGAPVGKVHGYAIGIAATPDDHGYWITATDGGVFTYGSARFAGSLGGQRLNAPIIGITANSDGRGYWLVGTDGAVYRFGTAGYFGSAAGRRLNGRIISITATVDGFGYWLVGEDGGVFTYGSARFRGSAAGVAGAPAVGMAHD
jgi:hypothetical protein